MTPKSLNITTSVVLFVALAIASIKCDSSQSGGSGADEPERGGSAANAENPLGSLGSFGNFGDMGGMFKSMTDNGGAAITDFVSSFAGPKTFSGLSGAGGNSEKREGSKESTSGFLGTKDPMDFLKLMLNPMEFMNRISKEFKLDKAEFTQAVGRGMNFGLETALQPPMVCVKIIEKVFVPDSCKLRFVCNLGKQLAMFKGHMPKFPDSFFEGASSAKAMYDGASGRECEHIYACENGDGPKLKKEYAGLKQKFGGSSEHENVDTMGEYAASQQSRVVALANSEGQQI